MTGRCSHCSHNGHNSRTCPNRGVKLFGVRLTDGSIRKSASMGNLTHYAGLSGGGAGGGGGGGGLSPAVDGHDPGAADGYASEDFVQRSSTSCRERKKGVPWTEEEHRMFLVGLQKLGKGDWRGIARNYVVTRTPTQVASHAQKYFIRQTNASKRKRRSSLFDIVPDESSEEHQTLPSFQESEMHDDEQHAEPPSVDEGCESMDSNSNDNAEAAAPKPEAPHCSYPMIFPAYFTPFFPYPFPFWPGFNAESCEQECHEIIKPTAVHSKTPIDVDELVGISKLSLREPLVVEHTPNFLQKLRGGADRQSAFHSKPSASSSTADSSSSSQVNGIT